MFGDSTHPVNITLLNHTMNDGSRQFAALPESVSWTRLRDHLARLPGVRVSDYVSDEVTEVWIDFSYRGHSFTINNQLGEFWFFVTDPHCAEDVLAEIIQHCQNLLG